MKRNNDAAVAAGTRVVLEMDTTTAQLLTALLGRTTGDTGYTLYEALNDLVGNPFAKQVERALHEPLVDAGIELREIDPFRKDTHAKAKFVEPAAGAELIKRKKRAAQIMAERAAIGEQAARMWQEVTEAYEWDRLNRLAKEWATDVGCSCKPTKAATYKPAHGGYPG